jgi:hypothetical protein
VNGRDVGSVEELRAATDRIAPGATVSLQLRLPDGRSTIVNFRSRG